MKDNIIFTNYIGLSQEELKKLPVEELAQALHEAIKEWDKLNQKVNQDSTNSNQAPSTDSPEAKAKRKVEEETSHPKHGARKKGAQPGHKAVYKPLLELREGDTVVVCAPETCKHCSNPLPEPIEAALVRHQKIDVEIHRRVTEYQVYRTTCTCCGHTTTGNLPEGVTVSSVSENVAALVGVLTGVCHLSRRMTRMLLDRLFEVPLSLGTVSKLEEELTEASVPVMDREPLKIRFFAVVMIIKP
jgi:transposase